MFRYIRSLLCYSPDITIKFFKTEGKNMRGINSITFEEGSQALPARPSGMKRKKRNVDEDVRIVTVVA
jgi:hypothetical protein